VNIDWELVALVLAAIVPSIILHEVSHGVVALAFGDDTAKRAGRITLNPIRHIDPFGTIILPAMLAIVGVGVFGWAKPVPVNIRKLHNPRQHSLYVSLAGPATNLVLAGVVALVWRMATNIDGSDLLWRYLFLFGLLNVLLAFFNMLPIPPLDGSAIVERFLPARWLTGYLKFRRYAILLLLGLFLFVPQVSGLIFDPALWLWRRMVS
jgi:Zn-dependent protease